MAQFANRAADDKATDLALAVVRDLVRRGTGVEWDQTERAELTAGRFVGIGIGMCDLRPSPQHRAHQADRAAGNGAAGQKGNPMQLHSLADLQQRASATRTLVSSAAERPPALAASSRGAQPGLAAVSTGRVDAPALTAIRMHGEHVLPSAGQGGHGVGEQSHRAIGGRPADREPLATLNQSRGAPLDVRCGLTTRGAAANLRSWPAHL